MLAYTFSILASFAQGESDSTVRDADDLGGLTGGGPEAIHSSQSVQTRLVDHTAEDYVSLVEHRDGGEGDLEERSVGVGASV